MGHTISSAIVHDSSSGKTLSDKPKMSENKTKHLQLGILETNKGKSVCSR